MSSDRLENNVFVDPSPFCSRLEKWRGGFLCVHGLGRNSFLRYPGVIPIQSKGEVEGFEWKRSMPCRLI